MQVANEIKRQLGNQALMMLGAKNLTTNGGNNLSFRIKGSRKINHINIKYNSLDLYDVEFGKIAKYDYKVVNTVENIYSDMLHEIIESETGLYTKLF